uniref:Retrovirus-related Pol polyprotein from transposon TNT 1-94 n=1 Tax=Tanacetum cinerariifolium TaxID=118510 RepID=A0A699HAB5_TANCI|nr:retrovirus-related Pol polyprotein from transposon TNT 1-94 [Tanacetum cinerariifolium]
MAISIILVSSYSSEESVGTSTGRVILFGTIPTTIPDTTLSMTPPSTHIDTTPTPTVSSTIPPSPDYSPASDTESDTSKDPSSDHIPPLPAISPFLSSTDDSLNNDIHDKPPSPTCGTPFTETTLSTQRSPAASGPVHMMTTRKRVGPLPTHHLAVRHSIDYSSSNHFALDDSSRDSSSTVAATDDSPAIPEHTTVETPMNMSPTNKAHFKEQKEAIHLILTGIKDEIYSTVDACQIAQEIWEAIERLQQGECLNIQDPEWSKFVTIVKQQHKLDEVSYHKLFDILKQYQKEVKELCAERLARNANLLALVATAQANQDPYYQTSESHKSYAPSSKPSIPTKNHTTTRYKSKKIAKLITPPSETASEEDIDPKQAQRNKDMQKKFGSHFKYKNDNQFGQFGNQRTMNVARAKINVGSSVVHQSGIQCFNCKEFRHFAKEYRKRKRVKDSTYHKEKMLMCKQAEKGVPLQAEQYDWLEDTNEKIDDQELEAHYNYMAKIQEVPTADSGTDFKPLEQVQNDTGYNVFANDLHHSKQFEFISNTCLVETNDSNVILDSPDMCDDDIQNDQNDVESDDELVKEKHDELIKQSLLTKSHDEGLLKQKTKDMEILIQTCLMPLSLKTQNDSFIFVHELKQEMHVDLKYVESLEKEIDELEYDKAEFSNIYDMILQDCVSNEVMCTYLLSLSDLDALAELQCLYLHKVKECDCPVQKLSKQTKSVSKEVHTKLLQHFAKVEKHSISLEIALQKCKEQIIQLILFIVDSGCTKHMTGNLKLLCNLVEKFLGTIRFGNDQFAPILGFRDLVQGNITINKVYYVEGLNYNLFLVGQFCDADLEVAFWKSTCFVRDLKGNDLLTGNRRSDLYIISLQESTSSTPFCLMAKASPTQAWLWHQRLSHLNFDYINLLSKKDVVIGLPKLKYFKDQLCSSCELSKAKRSSFKSKAVLSSKGRLNLLHMDLCGPMRIASINGKKYILVIVDDYSRYTWTLFLSSKDETSEVLKDFLTMIQRNLQASLITIRTDRGTEFLNKTLNSFFKEEGNEHQTSTARTWGKGQQMKGQDFFD